MTIAITIITGPSPTTTNTAPVNTNLNAADGVGAGLSGFGAATSSALEQYVWGEIPTTFGFTNDLRAISADLGPGVAGGALVIR